MTIAAQAVAIPLDDAVVRIVLAGTLGLFLGLEREWSHKSAGIRTFTLVSLVGAVFVTLGNELLLVVGGLLVVVQGIFLGVQGLLDEEEGLSLTTSVSLLIAYGVGALVAAGFVLEGVTVAVLSSLLLVLKRELHSFAWGLSRQELRSASEFAILAFVIYPILPSDPVTVEVASLTLPVELRIVWLMVVTVAGIGIVNYAIVQSYGGRGVAVTGFFGGLASSTAVVGTMLDHVRQRPATTSYAVAAILLANAAMAFRNMFIAVGFTLRRGVLLESIIPLAAVILGGFAVAAYTADWSQEVEMDLDSPFSLTNALVFGGLFLVILVAGTVAQAELGDTGLYITSALTGLVSSAGATTTAVILYRGGVIGSGTATIAILAATAASIVVKAGLTATSPNRGFAHRVSIWSFALLVAASIVTVVVAV